MSFEFLNKYSPNKRKFYPSLECPRKGASPCSPKLGPYGNKCQYPVPYLAYPLELPLKEPSLQVPLLEVPHWEVLCFQSPISFIFQSPWYMNPLPGTLVGPLCRKMPISRALLYVSFRVPSPRVPGIPQLASIERDPVFSEPYLNYLQFSRYRTPPQVFPRAPMEGDTHLQNLLHVSPWSMSPLQKTSIYSRVTELVILLKIVVLQNEGEHLFWLDTINECQCSAIYLHYCSELSLFFWMHNWFGLRENLLPFW